MKNYKDFKFEIKEDAVFLFYYYIIKDDQDNIIYDGEGCDLFSSVAEAEAEAKKEIKSYY